MAPAASKVKIRASFTGSVNPVLAEKHRYVPCLYFNDFTNCAVERGPWKAAGNV